jgi:hypothetical protein
VGELLTDCTKPALQEGKICKLLKSLNGLKQAPKQWHEKFDKTLTSAGFAVNEADKLIWPKVSSIRMLV